MKYCDMEQWYAHSVWYSYTSDKHYLIMANHYNDKMIKIEISETIYCIYRVKLEEKLA